MSLTTSKTLDPREFRSALGSFATGVTVVTTCSDSGEPVGLTANSFNSVSLEPPMVLWSLARTARSLPIFSAAKYWAVHVLAADQEELSNRFATRGEDKFGGLALEQGVGDIPLLPGCAARFQCRTAFQYEGGDHIILVGEVIAFDRSDSPPLVFHGGRYAFATQKLPSKTPPRVDELAGSFSEDFLGYLLGRAHFQFYRRLGSVLTEVGITDEQHFILATLTVAEPMSAAELDRLISFFLQSPLQPALEDLQGRGFLAVSTDATGALSYALTPAGHDAALRLIAAAKAVESQVTEHIGYADSAVLKTLLRRLVELTDPGLPKLWNADDDG